MIETYVSVATAVILFTTGLVAVFIITIINKHNNINGLSLVALLEATTTLTAGLIILVSLLKTVNLCSLTDIFIKNAVLLLPIINGLLSATSWNYQCWNRIKSGNQTKSRFKEIISSIIPQLSVVSFFVTGLLMFIPQNETRAINENLFNCFPNTMLSYIYSEKCDTINTSYYTNMFDKFLQDTNRSKSELFILDNSSRLFNSSNADEIVQRIYMLLKQTVSETNNFTANIQDLNKEVPRSYRDYDSMYSEMLQSLNISIHQTIDESPFMDYEQSIRNQTSIDFNNQLFDIFNRHSLTEDERLFETRNRSEPMYLSSINNNQCHKMCSIQIHNEKMFVALLILVFYLVPSFCGLILYFKVSMEGIQNVSTTHDVSLLIWSSKWAMILPVSLLSPSVLCLFMETMMCSQAPHWIRSVLMIVNQVYFILKNTLNVSVLKQSIKNQVHPLLEDAPSSSLTNVTLHENQLEETNQEQEIKQEE